MHGDVLVVLDDQVVDNKLLTLHRVLAHKELKHLVDRVFLAQLHTVETHVGAYEVGKLVGANFPKTLESRDLGIVAELVDGTHAFLVGIAIVGLGLDELGLASCGAAFALGFLAVAHTEERRLQM